MSAANNTNNTNPDYIFKVKTKEAYVIKILGELLSNTIKFAPIRVTERGISLTQSDAKMEQLIDIMLYKENFNHFKCAEPLSFIVNSTYLYKMLKSIKKKDSVSLYITREEPLKLCICVEKQDENNKTTTTIGITQNRPEIFTLPEGYENPVIMSTKEFQNMKNLHPIGRIVRVTSKPGYIKFFSDGGDLFSRDIVIGDENESDSEPYIQHFNTNHLTGLTKCANASQSGNIQIFVQQALPLKIKMRAGNLGDLTILIKSREMIEWESADGEENSSKAIPIEDSTGEENDE